MFMPTFDLDCRRRLGFPDHGARLSAIHARNNNGQGRMVGDRMSMIDLALFHTLTLM